MASLVPKVQNSIIPTIKIVLGSVISILILQIFAYDKPKLIYNSWYPFDISYSPMFHFILFCQCVANIQYTCMIGGFFGFYLLIISMTCAELEKLNLNLIIICPQPGSADDSVTDGDRYKQMQPRLNNCIRHHQQILSYIEEIEDALNPLMCALFFVELMALCFVAFSIPVMMTSGNYVQVWSGILGYIFVILVVANECWFPTQLSTRMEKIRDAAFGCGWVGAPIPIQKSILLIITRCNKEFYLSAGKFVPINIKTMGNMIKQSISYFMFLLEVQSRMEKEGD